MKDKLYSRKRIKLPNLREIKSFKILLIIALITIIIILSLFWHSAYPVFKATCETAASSKGVKIINDEVNKVIYKRNLTISHYRVLSKMDDENKVIDLAKKVITDNLSVHDLEKLSQEEKNVKIKSYNKSNFDTKYRMYENIIMDSLNTKVRVHKNKIELFFDGIDELEDLLNKMNVKIEDE